MEDKSQSKAIFVYTGVGIEGAKLRKRIQDEAKKRGYVKPSGRANTSAFILHCIAYTAKNEKIRPAKDEWDF